MPESRKNKELNTSQPPIPESIDNTADELLLDDILREFGDSKKQKSVSSENLDDEVQKILLSVQSALPKSAEAENREDTQSTVEAEAKPDAKKPADIAEPETAPVKQKASKPVQPPKPEKDKAKEEDRAKESKANEKAAEKSKPKQNPVRVVAENDSSTDFGADFSKYFGPEAGLATHINMPSEDYDEFDEPVKKKRRLFGRKKNKIIEEEEDFEASEGVAPAEEVYDDAAEVRSEPEPEIEEIIDIRPDEAVKKLVEEMGMIRLKLFVGVLLCIPLLYMTVAPKIGLYIPGFLTYVRNPYLYLFVTCALQILIMLMCVETFAVGIHDILVLKPNMESVVAFSNILSIAHIISIIVFPQWEGYYPYSAVSAISLLFAAYYRQLNKMARLRSYKTAAAMSKPYLVVCEKGVNGGEDAAVKYKAAQPLYFVNQTERRDASAKYWSYGAPLIMVLTIVCAAVTSFGTGQPQHFLWNLSGLAAAAAPFSICLSFSLPFAKAAKHLGVMGEAIAGWSAAEEFSSADSLIVTDTDLFPPGSITLNGLKVFGGYAVDKVISCSASLVAASGAGTARPFMELLHDQSAAQRKVTNFRHYENGGIGGEINGESIIAGGSSFMLRTGIKIPKDINIKNAIYIAINQELAGIFAVNYNIQGGVKKAVTVLRRNGITPVLAIRDFNITPAMIQSKLGISTDTADFPPIEERLSLSNPDRIFVAKPSAVISREGLGHYAECVVCARNLRRTTRICIGMTTASILLSVFLMFYLMFIHSPVQASPANLLAFMGLWLIPNLLAAGWVKM